MNNHLSFDSRPNLKDDIIATPRSNDDSLILNNFDSSFEQKDKKDNNCSSNPLSNLQIDLSEIAKENVKEKIENFRFPFDKEKIEELSSSLLKTYSQLQISQSEAFLSRMENDLRKRQERTRQIDTFVENQKMRLSEKEKVHALNRLLSDTNGKVLAKEQLNYMKEIISKQMMSKTEASKVYKELPWNDSSDEHFRKYQEDKSKAIKLKKEEQQLNQQKKCIDRSSTPIKSTKPSSCNKITKPKKPISLKSSLYYNPSNSRNSSSDQKKKMNRSHMAFNASNIKQHSRANTAKHYNQPTDKSTSTRKGGALTKTSHKLFTSKSQNNLIKDLQFTQSQIELYQMNISTSKQYDCSTKKLLESFSYKELKQAKLTQKHSSTKKHKLNNMNIITPVKKKKAPAITPQNTKGATSSKIINNFFDQNLNEQRQKLKPIK